MKLDYIFLFRNGKYETKNKRNACKELLEKIFYKVNKHSFNVDFNEKEYCINYHAYRDVEEKYFKICLYLDKSNIDTAKVLNYVDSKLRKSEQRKNYIVIVAYDGVSKFYADKLYPFLSEFERKIREFVYLTLVKSFGSKWYKRTISNSKELDNNIKTVARTDNEIKLIENALSFMTIYDLEEFLFTPYVDINAKDIFKDKEEFQKVIQQGNTEEMKSILSSLEPKSLWERFFEGRININDIQGKLKTIREYRNAVAHSKMLDFDNYKSCRKIVTAVTRDIYKAIDELNSKDFNDQQTIDSLSSFNICFESLAKNMENISKVMTQNISKTLEKLTNSILNVSNIQLESLAKVAENMAKRFT